MSVGYFFLRPKKPAAKEPNPSKPSNGSGEAVWGSFCPRLHSGQPRSLIGCGGTLVSRSSALVSGSGAAGRSCILVSSGGGAGRRILSGRGAGSSGALIGRAGSGGAGSSCILVSRSSGSGRSGAAGSSRVLVSAGVLGVCAGGFTGALALSVRAPAGCVGGCCRSIRVVRVRGRSLAASDGVPAGCCWQEKPRSGQWTEPVLTRWKLQLRAAIDAAASDADGAALWKPGCWCRNRKSC